MTSGTEREGLQHALNERYERFRAEARIPEEFAKQLSAPLFLHVFPEWIASKHRVLAVAQETNGWGIDDRFHNRPGTECVSCPFPQTRSFFEWAQLPQPVAAMEHAYTIFDYSRSQPLNYRGHFWRAFRELMAEVEGETATRAFLWSNLFRMDFNNESVLGARTTVVETIHRLQQGLLQDEIAILQPRAIIFFTGPYYDDDLLVEFPGGSLEPFRFDCPKREIAKLQYPGIPKSVRTYHPHYLCRSHRWHFLQKIAGWILSD